MRSYYPGGAPLSEKGKLMKIGELARTVGVSAKAIRYYEGIGLITPPERMKNGYRIYRPSDVATLRFVSKARSLGFSLPQVGDLLMLWQDNKRASADVKNLAMQHIGAINQRINELEAVRETLIELIEKCHGNNRPSCPILDELALST